MKNILYSLSAIILIGSLAASCHKNNDSNLTVNFQNIVGTYKVTAVVLSNGTQTVNYYDSIDVCQKDDLFKFNKDSTFNYVDAGTTCSPNGSFSSTWTLSGTTLTIVGGGDAATVTQLTSKTLVVTTIDNSTSPAITTKETLTRQ